MIDGRVFSAQQALAGGLVDDIGYLDGTIERAKQRAGVQRSDGDPLPPAATSTPRASTRAAASPPRR